MKVSKTPYPLTTICGISQRINTNPDFQRPAVWSKSQKQLLIDTILRNYDIPKLYLKRTGTKPDTYDVVDGQQRLRAVWEFQNGDFTLAKDAEPVDGEDVSGKSYDELPDELRKHFDIYPLDIVFLEDADDEDEVREMFLRLQNGTSLKSQEKRNAYAGKMRSFVKALAEHPFFKKVGFSNRRLVHDQVAAQMACLELAGGPTNLKNADLNRMYKTNESFNEKSDSARSVRRILDLLNEMFIERTPELERHNVITLYCIMAEATRRYVIDDITSILFKWFIDFESRRRDQEKKSEDEGDPDWMNYKEMISHSTDSGDSVKRRMEFTLRDLLEHHPFIRRKDNQRDFTDSQRLAVFRRDNSCCKLQIKCSGRKLTWDDWHCDHIIPWSKGGTTTVENGQVSCSDCNCAKLGKEPAGTSRDGAIATLQ